MYSDPGFPFLCLLYSRLGFVVMLLSYSHFHHLLFVFESWVVLGRFGKGWLRLETQGCYPDFGLHARAGLLTLEQALCFCFSAQAGVLTLEREYSSPSIFSAGRRTLEREFWRSSGPFWFCSSARAGSLTLERGPCLQNFWKCAIDARVALFTLERGVPRSSRMTFISVQILTFWITFQLPFSL